MSRRRSSLSTLQKSLFSILTARNSLLNQVLHLTSRSELYGMPGYECTPCHSRVSGLTLKNPQAFSGIMSLPVRGKRRGSLECGRDAPILRTTAAKEEFRIPACSIKHGVCGVFPSPVCQYNSEHTCASQTRLCMSYCPGGTDFPVRCH